MNERIENPQIAELIGAGYTVANKTDTDVTLYRPGTKVNHILHLVLSIITFGVWLIVWLLVALLHQKPDTKTVARWMTAGPG